MTTAVFDREAFEEMVNMTGYESKTTFWDDFCIAERFGHKAIKDTFNRAFDEWKSNIEYITELVMILNWRMWRLADFDEDTAKLYEDLWKIADGWCMDNLKGDDLNYFLSITD